ncbi:MAG TPA: hypothetical protein VKB57_20335 [Acidimicrobiales bacterium]|nr:hypothetical protein [Acidimicrobiales bacterium]
MRHRRLPLVPLSVALAVALGAACGADPGPAAHGPGRPGPDRAAPAAAPVVEVRREGGSVDTPVVLPDVLVMADGRLLSEGAVPAIYPGPLLPSVLEQRIGATGVERIVERARRAGLLRDVRYAGPSDDRTEPAIPTVVTLRVGGRSYVHRVIGLAYGEADPARARLERFLRSLDDLGQRPPYPTAFAPARYLVAARPAADDPPDFAPGAPTRPTVVDWPAATGVRLADAGTCAAVPAAAVRDALDGADQITLFRDGGVVYSVSPVPQVPGTGCGG